MSSNEANNLYFLNEKVREGARRNFQRLYKKKMERDCVSMEQALHAFFRKYHLEKKYNEYKFITYWKDIVGENIAKNALPTNIKNNVLYVQVKSSSWAQELTFQKQTIINRLNSYLNSQNKILDLKFIVKN